MEKKNIDTDLKELVGQLQQHIREDGYLNKCSKILSEVFEQKSWGSSELRKVEVLLEGAMTDDITKDLVSDLFEHLESNPPSDRLK